MQEDYWTSTILTVETMIRYSESHFYWGPSIRFGPHPPSYLLGIYGGHSRAKPRRDTHRQEH